MGNGCFSPIPRDRAAVKLVFWGGDTALFAGKQLAGELMLRFPNRAICDGDSFFIGRPVPALALGDELLPGRTYFLLPLDHIADPLTAASLAALAAGPHKPWLSSGRSPFEHMKGSDGRALVKVLPEFIASLITAPEGIEEGGEDGERGCGGLCTTPELRMRYAQLVGERGRRRSWCPALETIAESKERHVSSLFRVRKTFRSIANKNFLVRLLCNPSVGCMLVNKHVHALLGKIFHRFIDKAKPEESRAALLTTSHKFFHSSGKRSTELLDYVLLNKICGGIDDESR